MQEKTNLSERSGFAKAVDCVIALLCLAVSLFHIFIAVNSSISVVQQRVIHVMAILLIFFAGQVSKTVSKSKWKTIVNSLLFLLTVCVAVYFIKGNTLSALSQRGVRGISQSDMVFGVILIVMVLFVSYRTVGLALTILSGIFLAYAYFGRYMPDLIAHKGYTIRKITDYVAWTSESIFGSCIGASVSFVALYIIFGELLNAFGAGQFFIDIAYALTGRMKGGPAEASVVSSALMGSINGSAVANVVTTGTFTIPLMKKQKYRDEFAGAVEAVSSTGGQLMPPVMGAAAFLMAEATAIPYGTICLAALVPALMYYICIFSTVDVESLKANLTGMDLKDIPKLLPVLKKSAKLLLPIAVLILSLCVFGFSTSRSALYSMAVLIICCCFDKDDRFSLKKLVNALRSGAIGSTTVITATAICGIIISMLTMTGLGVKFSSLLISLGSSSLLISLLLAMLVCIVLGMGLPTAAAYIIASSTIATALIKLGVPVLGAHMFLFYFSSIACITPPVALASYAAAGICKAPPMKVSMEAVKIGIVAFLVPYAFIYNPSILTYDFSSPYMILDTIVTFVCCVVDALPISYVVQGYHYRPIRLYERALFLVIAIGLIWPGVMVPLISLAVFLLFWLPARAKYYKENPKLPTPAAN